MTQTQPIHPVNQNSSDSAYLHTKQWLVWLVLAVLPFRCLGPLRPLSFRFLGRLDRFGQLRLLPLLACVLTADVAIVPYAGWSSERAACVLTADVANAIVQ